ncbi:Peptidase family M23 [Leifsonia sp. 98AMF]|uniref:M23 family metallopeptidase n=1 Tax=unclassified Leifsonia TaxID=2663824 RepID=UPI000879F6CA|nr:MULTISPECIES: M23 family metallopeptidase [unclassified Leifsonia]SDH16267.1 Peptidase family M23 [Leifsonia sp. 197AMF]SDJ22009.1 Peptidase family M23 [Leifsonia sp. 466MF]SDK61757.1 Peptidase family M23 [Leifsonia sp. 157MF]SDN43694.1 Peptidase family M23 [Leifsonia sp. 509MF]SEN67420.1 Peptidase family M23 [Leifsonia sp. 467MF]
MLLIDPFPGAYDASDPYGNTAKPRTYAHTGSDWIVSAGTDAPALGAGVVANKQWHAGNGYTITVKLDDSDLYYAYLHLQGPALPAVGAHVARGDVLGKVGATGTNARGAHLHVTVSDAPTAYVGLGNRRDPWQLIQDHLFNTEGETMFIRIQSPKRGIALIGPGYYRHLQTDEEVEQSAPLVAKHLTGNDRQFDLWRSMALDGAGAKS